MGKTYRKKNSTLDYEPHTDDIMRYLHREYGDKRSGIRSAPKKMRKSYNKSIRAKDQRELDRVLTSSNDENFEPRKRTVTDDWR